MRTRLLLTLVVVVVLTGCRSGGGPGAAPVTAPPAPPAPAPAPPATPAAPAPPPSGPATSPTAAVVDRPDAPADLAITFVQAVAAGDASASFGLLTPGAQEGVGGLEGWADQLPEYTEGLGAYAQAPDLETRAVPLDEADATVVELLGTVTREGTTAFDVAALTVRPLEGGGLGLDLLTDFEPIAIEPGSGVVPAQPDVTAGIFGDMQLVLLLDGQRVEGELAGANVTARRLQPELAPGPHTFTVVAFSERERGVDAATAAWQVEG